MFVLEVVSKGQAPQRGKSEHKVLPYCQKKRKKFLLELMVNGRTIRNPRRIKKEASLFYKELCHQKSRLITKFQDGLVESLSPKASASLEIIPSFEEIKQVSCNLSKALSPDAHSLNFTRKIWDVVEAEFQ